MQNAKKDSFLFQENKGILGDGDRVWNFEETPVDATKSKSQIAFTCSSLHHGRFVGTKTTNGMMKHVTAVDTASESGKNLPTLFFVEGIKSMQKWFEPLSCNSNSSSRSTQVQLFTSTICSRDL